MNAPISLLGFKGTESSDTRRHHTAISVSNLHWWTAIVISENASPAASAVQNPLSHSTPVHLLAEPHTMSHPMPWYRWHSEAHSRHISEVMPEVLGDEEIEEEYTIVHSEMSPTSTNETLPDLDDDPMAEFVLDEEGDEDDDTSEDEDSGVGDYEEDADDDEQEQSEREQENQERAAAEAESQRKMEVALREKLQAWTEYKRTFEL
ncbi:hypothetical protein BV25DRAFT_898351 [Artomyces pyxidatus]|uniref:Uncharacterized protein n=1 Tax=Artomyces pyxidatus TaxID=48021 RepID=A0ACB8SWD4_9AGAM|nr:hypothetical protein BV25DRAFT_898351 [Artomyces pyxidatus]